MLDNTLGVVSALGLPRCTGDLAKALARGKLTVDRADLQIPDTAGGPSVPVIDGQGSQQAGGQGRYSQRRASRPFDLGFDIGVDIPGRIFVRGRGLDSEWTGKLVAQGRSGRAADRGRARRPARLLRPARPAFHHRPRRHRLRRLPTADPDDRHRGHRDDRRRHGHDRAAGAGRGPEDHAHQRARPCRRTRSWPASCSAPRRPRSRRCRACASRRRSRTCRAAAWSAARSPSSAGRSVSTRST